MNHHLRVILEIGVVGVDGDRQGAVIVEAGNHNLVVVWVQPVPRQHADLKWPPPTILASASLSFHH